MNSALLLILAVACLITLFAVKWGFYSLRTGGLTAFIRTKELLIIFLSFFLFYLLIYPILMVLLLQLLGLFMEEIPWKKWSSYAAILLSFIFILSVSRWAVPESGRLAWGERRGGVHALRSFLLGLVAWPLALPWVAIVLLTLQQLFATLGRATGEQSVVSQLRGMKSDPSLLLLSLFLVIAVVPILEELLFRGYLYRWIRGRFGVVSSILLSSSLFTVMHASPALGLANLSFLPPLFLLSCYLGFLYERQNSLLAPIALHAAFNSSSVLMILMS